MEEQKEGNPGDLGQGSGEGEISREPNSEGSLSSDGTPAVEPAEVPAETRPEANSSPAQPPEAGVGNPLHVKLQVYDGPLDLLLDLIKKNEMNIYDIPIAEITQKYLDYLEEMKQLDLEVAGEFIVMAATLIYIKSKMLLPTEKDTEENEGDDPRAELVRKLLEYQAFKEAAKELGILQTERGKMFTRQITDYYLGEIKPEDAGIDTFSANFFDLVVAFQNVLSKKERERPHEVFEEVISIEEKMIEIQSFLLERKKLKFSELFPTNWSRNELVATFLAILEIVRTRFARVFQDELFGEIVIEKREEAEYKSIPPVQEENQETSVPDTSVEPEIKQPGESNNNL